LSNQSHDRPRATVVADSITPWGHRLTTIKAEHHRPFLAETNTHRVITKSSASSRAIPVLRQLAKFEEDPAWPNVWASEQKGMQGGPPLEGDDLEEARSLFERIRDAIAGEVRQYVETHPIGDDAPEGSVRLHKSWLNRPLEVFQWHTALWTATSWKNFFHQRADAAAMPEFRLLAESVRDALDASTPRLFNPGEYHLPFVWDDDDVLEWSIEKARFEMTAESPEAGALELQKQVSIARCARTSYETQDGKRDPAEDVRLYRDRLSVDDPMHAAPMEHVATPASWNERTVRFLKVNGRLEVSHGPTFPPVDYPHLDLTLPVVGNFVGWSQVRLEVEFERQIRSYT
jgi:hypothetical protein